MAAPSAKTSLTATPPAFAVRGKHNSLLLEMPGLGYQPPSGRLLRGLTPYLDEQGASHVFLLTGRKWREPWSGDAERIVQYQELVHWERGPDGGVYRGVCAKDTELEREEILQAFESEPLDLIDFAARRLEAAVISNREPLQLEICHIAKPWGREGWYTGIEERGTSSVRTSTGATELPYALGMFPVPLIGEMEGAPILLKTLAPFPEPVQGDLYLEVHRHKWETYIVLSLDETAWPEGKGCLRAGLNKKAVGRYRSRHGDQWEEAIAAALADKISLYEQVRREIDDRLDKELAKIGEDPALPVSPATRKELLDKIPKKLRTAEREKREAVESFLGKTTLRVGDVVSLPPGVLHSLQHGVKVIEFQTPTYERLIAMFSQKVLTQSHWDVKEAVRLMDKAPFQSSPLEVLEEEDGILVERVVDFPQFQVDRTRLEANRSRAGESEGSKGYRLLIVTEGKGELRIPGGKFYPLEPESAFLLPATLGDYTVSAISAQGLSYLQAFPVVDEKKEREDKEMSLEELLENTW